MTNYLRFMPLKKYWRASRDGQKLRFVILCCLRFV